MQHCGVFPDLSNEHYHADHAISRSGIMMFRESPYKYWANYINPSRPTKESTKAMDFGTAFHAFILEGDKYYKDYIVELEKLPSPTRVLLKNVGRTAYDAYKTEKAKIDFMNESADESFAELSEGKIIISEKDVKQLENMRDAILSYPEAKNLIEGALYEQSYFWQDKETGLWLKSRPDILHDSMIVDLKTCVSANTRAYQRALVDGGLHIQGAMVREAVNVCKGRDIPNVINICCEKQYPYEIGIKIISEEALKVGRDEFKATLVQMKECFDTGIWPSHAIETVELPKWAI